MPVCSNIIVSGSTCIML